MKTPIGFDTETDLITQQRLAPRMICATIATPPTTPGANYETYLTVNHDWAELRTLIETLLTNHNLLKVGQSIGYDLTVIASNIPEFLPLIFDALANEAFSDVGIREKLLTLATTGDLDFIELPDGSKMKARWNLETFVKKYFGKDISQEKGGEDAWRLNYKNLDNMPIREWPAEAVSYAKNDAMHALMIHQMQDEAKAKLVAERTIEPFKTESFRVYLDFCLRLMSAWGVATDPEAIAKLEAEMAEELKPENLTLLRETGILRPGEPGKPKKGGGMTKDKPESKNVEALHNYVLAFAKQLNGVCESCGGTGKEPMGDDECTVCNGNGSLKQPPVVKLRYTDKDNLSVDAEFLEDYAHLDPVLTQYQHRQDLQGIVTREIPRMKLNGVVAPVVHPQYDCLKSTGRVSSFSSKSKDYASFNCENVDPRARGCFVPRPGSLFFSLDFSQMELGTVAQKCYDLFGHSVLRDKINAGVDVHAYTGAQLAFAMDTAFAAHCNSFGTTTRDQIFDLFKPLKESTPKFFAHWRKFAKPVNLGYPGGLGARTFVKLAKVAYDVQVDEDTAGIFRDLWRETYPEFVEYFNYINKNCIDPHNKGIDQDDGTEYNKYFYTSPDGMYRAGCDYCACANGMGLQTPSAEGALSALVQIVTLCYNWKLGSIIGPDDKGMTVQPIFFIHDEICGEIRDDDKVHERMMEMKRIMIESMRRITPDVAVNANPAIMRRWNKYAEPVYGADGRLQVWEPK